MDNKILNAQLQEQRFKISEIIKELHQMTIDIKNEDLARTISDLRERIQEPFMFVIVGEVKAGKSSFVNALLDTGKDICKVAPDPCTDVIQQIIHGEKENVITINDFLKKIQVPVDILKDIAIVDTPGTNTISDHHQEITERFIPGSDLIVFVFEAKNPYRQSAWDFFDYIHKDWRKKIIFILQQKDLMDAGDLEINLNGVRKHAIKKGITEPKIFGVSAKQELEGKHEESGFLPLRKYVADNITGGQAPVLKLLNNIEISQNVGQRIKSGLEAREAQLNADKIFRKDIVDTLNEQEKRSNNQVDLLVENLLGGYDRATKKTEDELDRGLGFLPLAKRTFLSVFSKKKTAQDWLSGLATDLEENLNKEMREKLNAGVHDIAESIQQMAKLINLKIKQSTTILKNNHEIFGDIADRRISILKDLQEQFSRFMNKEESFIDSKIFPEDSSYSPNIATGSGLAVVGVILSTVAQGMVFDITGGIISTIGFLFAGATVHLKRKKILASYNQEIAKGRVEIEAEIKDKLNAYIRSIKHKIDENFDDFDALMELEDGQIRKLNEQYNSIDQQISEVESELKAKFA